MKNTIGQSIAVTLFGESHGKGIGAVIDGLAPGIAVNEKFIASQLQKRRPSSKIDTARVEKDNFQILSGVFNEKTTGTPICIVIPNENTQSKDYNYGIARPSHADFSAYAKYHGFEDYRGGGHFSGRITAALVAVGGILIPALNNLGINLATHILSCGGEKDRQFNDYSKDIEQLKESDFPTLSTDAQIRITDKILQARDCLDSVGGITESAIIGLPSGIGEPWFDSIESLLSHAIFSIGGVKGIEFGLGFGFADKRATEVNDEFAINNDKIVTTSNNNGGINGGITNGMPITFRLAVKPTPSIATKQQTVDFVNNKEENISIHGRHDPAIIRRICPVVDSVCAIVLCDALAMRYGTDVFIKGIK